MAFAAGWQSVEVVQAFACLAFWKEPDDTVSEFFPHGSISLIFATEIMDLYRLCERKMVQLTRPPTDWLRN